MSYRMLQLFTNRKIDRSHDLIDYGLSFRYGVEKMTESLFFKLTVKTFFYVLFHLVNRLQQENL